HDVIPRRYPPTHRPSIDRLFSIFFFFQAEDGIRDKLVTGVQTCALPISVLLAHQTGRAHELAIATARLSPLPLKLALAVEHRDGVVPLVRDVHLVPSIGRNTEGPGRTAVPFAPLEELGEEFLFAGTADLHLVDT